MLKGLSRAEATKRLHDWFKRLDIMAWWNKKLEELSKGMQQKVQFVITVLHQPQLVILDEPFSGFDPVNAEILKREILRLRDEGATIISPPTTCRPLKTSATTSRSSISRKWP